MTPIEIAARAICAANEVDPDDGFPECGKPYWMMDIHEATAALAALEAAGYRIVAPEATEEMLHAGMAGGCKIEVEGGRKGFSAYPLHIWKAMHAAAPRWAATSSA